MIFETKTMSEIAQLEDIVSVQLIFNESLRWLNVLDNRVVNEEKQHEYINEQGVRSARNEKTEENIETLLGLV